MMQDQVQNTGKYIAAHRKRRHITQAITCLAVVIVLGTVCALVHPALARELKCTIPEHTHTDACYQKADDGQGDTLTCTNTEEGHTHGTRCYGTWVLTCGMEEHTHTEECYTTEEDRPTGDASAPSAPSKESQNGTADGSASSGESQSVSAGTLNISLLYGEGESQESHPDGVSYYTHSTMSGYIKLEPKDLENDLTDVTVTLSMPKQYVEKDSIHIPDFKTDSDITKYEILSVAEDGANYTISIHFSAYDKTQTLVLPFTLSFLDDVVPDNYQLPVTGTISGGNTTEPNIYKPLYKDWGITKFVNSNHLDAFSRDGAEVVVTPKEDGDNPYLDDLTYVDFAFVVNNYTNANCSLADFRDASQVTLTDTLPTYTDKDGVSRIAAFDADKNPGWTLSADGKTVSKTYTGEHSEDVLMQIYQDQLHLRFPGMKFETQADKTLLAEATNHVSLNAVPSKEAQGETRPTAEDDLRFCLTDDPGTGGQFTKNAGKNDIYDVDVYKTNPYPWHLTLSNDKVQPLRHIVIQDRKITEDGKAVVGGLDEALKFVRLESTASMSVLPEGKTFADVVEKVVAYYTDGTTQELPVTEVDASGDFTVTFDEDKVCDGYDIIFQDDYEMQYGEKTHFMAYTVYRDPDNTHVTQEQGKITYWNKARSVNSYQQGQETVYAYLYAGHSYDMLPTTEHLEIKKLTLCNDGTTQLAGRGGNHVGDYYLYQLTLSGSLLEPKVKEYQDLRVVDLLPDGVQYDSIYLLQQPTGVASVLDGGQKYQPEILENYHNSGRTAVIFHLNGTNLQKCLQASGNSFVTIYFWVQIQKNATSGTIRNDAYVVGDNLDEYQGSTGGTEDAYDLNNNGKTDDRIAYAASDATIIAAQSIYAEKFIAPAGSDSWSKQGLALKAGQEFDYRLKVTNETTTASTGLTVYDTLPQLGDQNLFGTTARGSEFHVQLRSAITPPEGYTVYYTTSQEVYQKPMEDMVDADIWSTSVADVSTVTAFKLVAQEGTELAEQSSFQVRVPVRTPDTFSAESLQRLDEKSDQDQDSGTMSYLEAINSFGFTTKEATSPKESNTVWARVPFAGFWVKKVDGASGAALSGAEFTLTDQAGDVVGKAVSDDQGLLQFRKLTEGSYTLTETKVPEGYMDKQLSLSVTITQNPTTMAYTVAFGGGYTGAGSKADPLCIQNDSGYELPDTGGRGVTLCYVLGAAALLTAAVLLVLRRQFR